MVGTNHAKLTSQRCGCMPSSATPAASFPRRCQQRDSLIARYSAAAAYAIHNLAQRRLLPWPRAAHPLGPPGSPDLRATLIKCMHGCVFNKGPATGQYFGYKNCQCTVNIMQPCNISHAHAHQTQFASLSLTLLAERIRPVTSPSVHRHGTAARSHEQHDTPNQQQWSGRTSPLLPMQTPDCTPSNGGKGASGAGQPVLFVHPGPLVLL